MSGTFVVNGSPTKTQMVDSAGGRTQLSMLVTTVVVLMVLLFLTAPLAYMPDAVLSAVVFLIGVELVDVKSMRWIYAERRSEFWVALITALTVVLVGVEQGIILAIVLSLLDHVRRGYRPKNSMIVAGDGRGWRALPVTQPLQVEPGLMIYRFTHSMYYANAEQLSEQILALAKNAEPRLSWFCIDASAVDDVDFSAAETLHSLHGILEEQGIRPGAWLSVVAAAGDSVLVQVGQGHVSLARDLAKAVQIQVEEKTSESFAMTQPKVEPNSMDEERF